MTVDLPPIMIDTRVNQMVDDLEANLKVQGINLEVYLAATGKTVDELKEDYREEAKKTVLTDILFTEVAHLEDIKVDENDVNMEIAIMANMYRTTPKQIVKALKDNGQTQTVISNLRQRKAMQFIIEHMAGAEQPAEEKVEEKVAVEEKVDDEKSAETSTETKSEDK